MIVTHPKNAVLDSHSKLHVACSHTSQSFRFVIVDEYNSEFADLRKIPLQAFPPRSRTSFIVSQHEHVFTLSGCLPYRSQIWDTQLHPINDGSSIVKLPKSWISVSREPTAKFQFFPRTHTPSEHSKHQSRFRLRGMSRKREHRLAIPIPVKIGNGKLSFIYRSAEGHRKTAW